MTVSRVALSPAAEHCRDLTRRVSPDRALLGELVPPPNRPPLWAIAAFDWEIARIPELVTEPMLGAIRYQWWRDAWREIAEGNPRRHPVAEALAESHAVTPFSLDIVDAYIDAREAELDGPPADLLAMRARAEATGGNLARMEAVTLSVDEERAAAIGTAWSMVGEARALAHKLRQSRHGLPADRVANLSPGLERLDPANLPVALKDLLREICAEAMAILEAHKPPPSPLYRGYRRLTLHYRQRLRRAGWNPFVEQVHTPTFGRVWQIVVTKLGA